MLSRLQNDNGKVILAIFAHPDDEAFGPGGTLAKFSKNNQIHLICVTKGDAGSIKNIAVIRSRELQKSAKILGIKKIYHLGYKDGKLSNSIYHKLAKEIEKKIVKIKPEILITFEPLGISGHIDHIAVSLVTAYVANKYKFVKKVMYHCVSYREAKCMDNYFIYFPSGFKREQVDEIIDVSEVWKTKIRAMHCHESQLDDVKMIQKILEKIPKEEYFITSIRR